MTFAKKEEETITMKGNGIANLYYSKNKCILVR
jgi:hypothetical protein